MTTNELTVSIRKDHPVVGHLLQTYGDDLQGAMTYDEDGHDILYMRSDLEEVYDREEIETVSNEALFESMVGSRHEDVFAFGELGYVARGFDEGIVVQVIESDRSGVLFSLDVNAALDIDTVIGAWPEVPTENAR